MTQNDADRVAELRVIMSKAETSEEMMGAWYELSTLMGINNPPVVPTLAPEQKIG